MKKPDITPGPWFPINNGQYHEIQVGPGSFDQSFVNCYDNDYIPITEEMAEANARAIAAVPDMIEALIHVAEHLEDYAETHGRDPKNVPGYPRVIEALRKAGVELEGGCHAS